jgi:hypothetical protein
MWDALLAFFRRHGPHAICGPCLSSLLGERGFHLLEGLEGLQAQGTILFALTVCHVCGDDAPSYRLAA